jgi:outer membrane protein
MSTVQRLALLMCVCALAVARPAIGQAPCQPPFALARLPAVRDEPPPPAPQVASPLLPRPDEGAPVEVLPTQTLEAAWAQALAMDQQLMAGAARVESAAYALDAASAQRLPLLGVSADYVVRDNESAFRIESPLLPFSFTNPYLPRDNYAFEGRVDVPIYTGGRVTSEIDAAECNVRAMERRLDRCRLDLKLRVAEDYVAVLRAEQEVAVGDSHERSLAAHAHDIELLHDQQRVPRSDLLSAQVALADAQHQVIKAKSDLDACRAAYNRRLGRPLTTPVQLATLEVDHVEHDVDARTQQALAQRPELSELDAQTAVHRHQAETAAAARRAQVHVQGAYTFQENEYQTPEGITSAGVGIWWNLHDGGRARSQAREQSLQAQALAHMRADVQSMIQLEVRQAWLVVQETRNRLAVTRQSIERAEENLRVTRQRYASGMATNTDVLGAESLRVQTYRNHNNAIYDAALADLRLQRAAGTL